MISKTNTFLSSLTKKEVFYFFSIFLIILLSSLTYPLHDIIQRFEFYLIDQRMSWFQSDTYSDDIIIISLDSSSLNKLDQWPWPRHYWSSIVKTLDKYGASVIGIDILFDSHSPNADDDTHFGNVLSNYSNIVLASRKHIEKQASFEMEVWSTPIDSLSKHATHGFVNMPFDMDGLVRRALVTTTSHKESTPISFDLLVYALSQDITPKQVTDIIYKRHNTNPFLINMNDEQSFYINFKLASGFTTIPFYQLYEQRLPDPTLLKNKQVLIGATDPALNDLFYTPLGLISGVELHAYSLQTLISNRFLYTQPFLWNYILIILTCFLLSMLVFNVKSITSIFLFLTLLFFHGCYVILVFALWDTIAPWASYLSITTLYFIILILLKLTTEEREKRFIRSIFSQYVAPDIVSILIKSPDALHLGGKKKHISILFSDIRSFTTLSEKFPAEDVIAQLNEYLDAMTHLIFKWKGTVDKYIGDEIMAIWGAPVHHPYHPILTICCAWEQLSVLQTLQTNWANQKRPILEIGIGIHTGTAIVGNIGSSIQKDYTAIGDDVNYASRLQTLSRNYASSTHPSPIIISESTYTHVKDYVTVIPLGMVPVKGKQHTEPAYHVVGVDIKKGFKLIS